MTDDRQPSTAGVFRVCMVCTGNICRSPMAEAVLRDLVHKAGLDDRIQVSSAGTGDWHVGEKADPRTLASLQKAGYQADDHRARQFDPQWFDELDLVVVLDRGHERVVRDWADNDADRSKIRLLSSFDSNSAKHPDSAGHPDIPDPYYSNAEMFDQVLGTIERDCIALFAQLEPALRHTTPAAPTALPVPTPPVAPTPTGAL